MFAVHQNMNSEDFIWNESHGTSRLGDSPQILSVHEQIHILGGAHGFFVHRADPKSDRIAANHGVLDSRAIQRSAHGSQQTFYPFNRQGLYSVSRRHRYAIYLSNSAAMIFRLPSTATTSLIWWPSIITGYAW